MFAWLLNTACSTIGGAQVFCKLQTLNNLFPMYKSSQGQVFSKAFCIFMMFEPTVLAFTCV